MSTRAELRDAMPSITVFIDECRIAFGVESVNDSLRAGMQGIPNRFYATENGITIGTPFAEPVLFISSIDMVIRPVVELTKKRGRK